MNIFRNPYDNSDLEVGIEQLDQYRSHILRNDGLKPFFSVPPCQCEPMLADQDCRSLDSAESQLLRSIMAARLEICELLVVENSKIYPEETEYR